MTTVGNRTAEHPIDPLFLQRWSPCAFTGEEISEADLLTMLEAGHWSSSSYNSQPWIFVYARRNTPAWEPMLSLLNEFNQGWAKAASALVILASKSTMIPPGKTEPIPSRTHSLDAGSAWAYVALQATRMGWYTHGMVGLDFDRAFAELGLHEGHRVEMAFAVGRLGDKSTLPPALQEREQPSGRNPLSASVFEGKFSG